MAEDAARAGDGHGFAQWADFAQQAGDDLVVTLAVIRGFNALAAKLDRRGENYA